MSDLLNDRAQALVEVFFSQRDAALLAKLRAEAADASNVDALKAATGISDAEVLRDLTAVGVTPDTLVAFSLVPMFAVAWSDRMLDPSERDAILVECLALGIGDGSPSHALVSSWLSSSPNPELIAAWDHFAAAMGAVMPAAERARVRDELLTRARRVARASGGVLGIGATSAPEARAIAWLERVLGG